MKNNKKSGDTHQNSDIPQRGDTYKSGEESPLFEAFEVVKNVGAFEAFEAIRRFSLASQTVALVRIKAMYDSKDYIPDYIIRKYGKTFKKLCESIGINYETARQNIRIAGSFGLQTVSQLEQLGMPFNTLRRIGGLRSDLREKAIDAIMNNGSADLVKEVIEDLTVENMRLREATTRKKEELVHDLDVEMTQKKLFHSHLKDAQEKNERLKEQVKKLKEQNSPDVRVRTLRTITESFKNIMLILQDADLAEDPVFKAEKDHLHTMVEKLSGLLG